MTAISDLQIQICLSRGKRQQGDVARPLAGSGKAALMRLAYAGKAARNNLSPLGHELSQQPNVFVVDVVDLLDAELAYFLAAEELASAIAATTAAGASWPTGLRPCRWC